MNQIPSYNQQKCYIHWEPFTVRYSRNIPEDPIEAAIDVLDVVEVLQPIFEPTSADLRVGCISKLNRQRNNQASSFENGWHIRSSDLPEKVEVDREFGSIDPNNSPNFEVPLLSKQAMIDWVIKALNQKYSDSKVCDLAWFDFNFNTVRTKIFTEELLVGQQMMRAFHDRYGYYEYPLVRESGQLWVYSPHIDLYLFPTFSVSVNHDEWDRTMGLKIKVGWSWWTQFGFKERDVLLKTIPQIEALGWDLDFCSNWDKFYVPREG